MVSGLWAGLGVGCLLTGVANLLISLGNEAIETYVGIPKRGRLLERLGCAALVVVGFLILRDCAINGAW